MSSFLRPIHSWPLLALLALAVSEFAWAQTASTAAPGRLAIVAEDPAIAPAADLLTVAFSHMQGVQVLERAEIERVCREQALSAGNRDYLKLGQILAANGLLLLSPAPRGGALEARLIAVEPGVVIDAVLSPSPVEDRAQWADGLAKHFAPLLSKLEVSATQAVPISIVQLHSAVRSPASLELERQASLLAAVRLSHQRELFVLERQRMQRLTAEKQFQPPDNSAFWNGSYLLEGVLDRDSYTEDTVTLHARLVPPRGGSPIPFEVRSRRTNLVDLANQLADKVSAALNLSRSSVPWQPADEARRYFAEAQWAYHWDLYRETAVACEASWALGAQTKEVAELRLRAYADAGLDTAFAYIDRPHRVILYGLSVWCASGQYVMQEVPALGASTAPDPDGFAQIRHALELYCQDYRTFIADNPNPGLEWRDLGLDILEKASYWLRHYYYTAEARAGQEEALASVRASARELAALVERHPAFTHSLDRKPSLSTSVRGGPRPLAPRFRDPKDLPTLKVLWGASWFDTPEQGLEVYRQLIADGSMSRLRKFFLGPGFDELSAPNSGGGTLDMQAPVAFLSGWAWADRQRAPAVWHRFIGDLCAATNGSVKLEGLFLQCSQAPNPDAFDKAFHQMIAWLEDQPDQITASQTLTKDIDELLRCRARPGSSPGCDALWNNFKQTLTDRKTRLERDARLAEMKQYLAGTNFDFARFSALFSHYDYREDEARVLLAALGQYRTNILPAAQAGAGNMLEAKQSSAPAPRIDPRFFIPQSAMDRLELTLKGTLNKTSNVTPQPPPAAPPPAAIRAAPDPSTAARTPAARPEPGFDFRNYHGGPPASGTDPATLPATNVLEVTRFCSFPERLFSSNAPPALSIVSLAFREGRLWAEARLSRLHDATSTGADTETFFNRSAIFSIDPESLRWEVFVLDRSTSPTFSPRTYTHMARGSFEIFNGALYITSTDVIKRYSLKDKSCEDLPIPVSGHARFSRVENRLLLSTDDSILEILPDGKSTRVLASRRRQPPLTSLDAAESYDCAPVLSGPQHSLIAFADGRFWQQTQNGNDWIALNAPPVFADVRCAAFDDGIIVTSGANGQERQMLALFTNSNSPELLLVQPGFWPGRPTTTAPRTAPAQRPRWLLPEGVYALNYPTCLEGHSLWVLAGRLTGPHGPHTPSSQSADRRAVLFRLLPGASKPLAIHTLFHVPQLQSSGGFLFRDQVTFESTPCGLVVAAGDLPGFWIIPHNQLADRLKQSQAASPEQSNPNPAPVRAAR